MSYTAPSITASGASFATFQGAGVDGLLNLVLAAQSAAGTNNPSAAPTLAANGTGHSLAANTYYVVFTETNGWGETLGSPASSSQAVTAGEQLVITFPALQSGNSARNVYLGLSSTGPWSLYATGITTSPYDCTAAAPSNSYAISTPTVNTTGLTWVDANGNTQNRVVQFVNAARKGNLQTVWQFGAQAVRDWLRGDPATFRSTIENVRRVHAALLVWAEVFNEIGTLVDANAGTLNQGQDGIGNPKTYRTWP